ncbi:(4Fe-4S)-binding protein [Desulfitobacterium hafniense]|uniref:(4Fe-4S)-binding protein n=1 Tax=Desulfitobacterium hafniense TaxID=49338 RepID=A0A0W1JLK4_DESHA|nr:4Fe-4S binding protein [Desulfitobacterium hafniense]KTE92434.1 (4Fe-4S)-binding protein [Desulfitobacterium hafniense]
MLFNQGYSIKIAENRCLNQRHSDVECNHCSRNCPSDAIINHNAGVLLDAERCSGCGVCLIDCPTQVFSSNQWDETTILQDVLAEGWKITEFFCGVHPAPFKKEKSQTRGAVQIPACLSAISKGAWYELGLRTEIELHVEACEDCPMKNVLERLKYNIGLASEWLEASGHPAEISTIFESQAAIVKKNLKALETGLKATSRRDFFLALVGKGKPKTKEIPDRSQSFSSDLNCEREDSLLADWQKRLAKVYPQNMIEGYGQPAYWPTIKKSKDCVNCGMCAAVCPTKTLQIVMDGNCCTHYFTSGLCIDCRICQLFCPREAISRDREKVENPFALTPLFSAPSINCERCNFITFTNSDNLCYWCKEEVAIDNDFKETCRKIFLNMKK